MCTRWSLFLLGTPFCKSLSRMVRHAPLPLTKVHLKEVGNQLSNMKIISCVRFELDFRGQIFTRRRSVAGYVTDETYKRAR